MPGGRRVSCAQRRVPQASPGDGQWSWAVRWAILTAGLFVLYFLVANVGPLAVGLWQDDAIYLCTAKSLAEGSGYRMPSFGRYAVLAVAVLSPIYAATAFLVHLY